MEQRKVESSERGLAVRAQTGRHDKALLGQGKARRERDPQGVVALYSCLHFFEAPRLTMLCWPRTCQQEKQERERRENAENAKQGVKKASASELRLQKGTSFPALFLSTAERGDP